jgi:serine phosphatase RsbU (regulator of sigma subunit)
MSGHPNPRPPAQWLDVELVFGLFEAIADPRPTWLRLVDADARVIVELGPTPIGQDAIESAEVRVGTELLGTISIAVEDGAAVDATGGAMLAEVVARILTDAASHEVELESLTTDLMDKYEEVTLLLDLSRAFRSDVDLDELCAVALEKAVEAVAPDTAWVALAPSDTAPLVVTASYRPGPQVGLEVPRGGGVAGILAARREMLLLHPGDQRPASVAVWADETRALLGVPLTVEEGGEVDGAIVVVAGPSRRFTAGEQRLLSTIASQLGAAVRDQRRLAAVRDAQRVQQELDIAASIQLGLLPRQPPVFPAGDVAGLCVPAASVGGDYYDLYVDQEGRLAVVVADVAGHSISSALMMTAARAVLRRELLAGSDPDAVLEATNTTLHDDLAGAGLFITIFCARFDPRTGILEYANGGQTLPLLARSDGAVQELDAEGLPAGFLPDAQYELGRTTFGAGDRLLLMTDGVVEARGAGGDLFGEERTRDLVAAHRGGSRALVDHVFTEVRAWMGDRPQADDVTLVAVTALEAVDGAREQPPR